MRRHRYTGNHAHQDSAVPRIHTNIRVTNSHTQLQSRTPRQCRAPPLILALTLKKDSRTHTHITVTNSYKSHEHVQYRQSHTSRTSKECSAPPLILALTPQKRFTNSYTYKSHELTHISHIQRMQCTAPYTRTNPQNRFTNSYT